MGAATVEQFPPACYSYRWQVKTCFQRAKGQLGLSYQGQSGRVIKRFWLIPD